MASSFSHIGIENGVAERQPMFRSSHVGRRSRASHIGAQPSCHDDGNKREERRDGQAAGTVSNIGQAPDGALGVLGKHRRNLVEPVVLPADFEN
jgi:hypothetical protein